MATTPPKALRKMRHNNTVKSTKENTIMTKTNTLPGSPLINASQAKKLKRLAEEAAVATATAKKKSEEYKEYRNSLPIGRDTETVVGNIKIQKTYVDGSEKFDLAKFKSDFTDGIISKRVFDVVTYNYVSRNKGYDKFTVSEVGK